MELSDSVLRHLREVVDLPDLARTRYELEDEIGRGGMGVVYAARDRELDRRVALKVMDAALAGEARADRAAGASRHRARLRDRHAARRARLLRDETGGRQRARPLPGRSASLGERLRVVQRVGEALAYAHSCGVLHRDLKPQNVMVGAFGEVYVMDWGVDGVAGTPGLSRARGRLDERSRHLFAGRAAAIRAAGASAPPALRAHRRRRR